MTAWTTLEARCNTAALAVFGEAVVVDGVSRTADFVEPSTEVEFGEVSAIGRQPQLVMLTSEVPATPVGKGVTARSRSFVIADVRDDGRGMSTVMLEAA
jgi:hypothetical protein